jgi:hypothetical protein
LKSEKTAGTTIIPLQVKTEHRATLLHHPAYKKRDIVDLFVEVRNYVQGRLPVTDRAVTVAVLLSRDKRLTPGEPLAVNLARTVRHWARDTQGAPQNDGQNSAMLEHNWIHENSRQ